MLHDMVGRCTIVRKNIRGLLPPWVVNSSLTIFSVFLSTLWDMRLERKKYSLYYFPNWCWWSIDKSESLNLKTICTLIPVFLFFKVSDDHLFTLIWVSRQRSSKTNLPKPNVFVSPSMSKKAQAAAERLSLLQFFSVSSPFL